MAVTKIHYSRTSEGGVERAVGHALKAYPGTLLIFVADSSKIYDAVRERYPFHACILADKEPDEVVPDILKEKRIDIKQATFVIACNSDQKALRYVVYITENGGKYFPCEDSRTAQYFHINVFSCL